MRSCHSWDVCTPPGVVAAVSGAGAGATSSMPPGGEVSGFVFTGVVLLEAVFSPRLVQSK